jgi:hypothetical protein
MSPKTEHKGLHNLAQPFSTTRSREKPNTSREMHHDQHTETKAMYARPFALSAGISLALAATASVAVTPSPAAAHSPTREQLVFESTVTRSITAGPDASHVGHEQIVSGFARDVAGRRVGRFAITCRWIQILAGGDPRERCVGSGKTAEGQLEFAGLTRLLKPTDLFAITGGTGAYRGAHGTFLSRDLGYPEGLAIITITPRPGVFLHVGMIPRPPANTRFIARANRLCATGSRQLAALPPFPFPGFDPLHPDPALLPQVGAFFTGPGDVRPILQTLNTRLRALGRPPAERREWKRALDARAAALAAIDWQDQDALAADAPAFVQDFKDGVAAFRRMAITTAVFGTTQCTV